MQFSPTAIIMVVIGALCVIIGIKGSNKAVFQTLTGHTTGSESASAGPGIPNTGPNPVFIPNAPLSASGNGLVSGGPIVVG